MSKPTIHVVDRFNAAPWSAPWSKGNIDALLLTLLHGLESKRGNSLKLITETIERLHQIYFQPYFVPDNEDEEFEPILQLELTLLDEVGLEMALEDAIDSPGQAIVVHLTTPNGTQFFWDWFCKQSSKKLAKLRFVHWHCLPNNYALMQRENFLRNLPPQRKLDELATVLVHTEAETANELYVAPYKLALPIPEFDHWQHTPWSELRESLTTTDAPGRSFRHQLRRQIGLVDQTIVTMQRLDIWQSPEQVTAA